MSDTWTKAEISVLNNLDLSHKELGKLLPHRSYEKIRRKTYFEQKDVDFLREQITDKIGIETKIRNFHNQYLRIIIYGKKVLQFLEYVGDSPCSCYDYKWRVFNGS